MTDFKFQRNDIYSASTLNNAFSQKISNITGDNQYIYVNQIGTTASIRFVPQDNSNAIVKPVYPKTLHASTFSAVSLDATAEVEWDYEKWLKHSFATYPEYFNGEATLEYDGYKIWNVSRIVYDSASSHILYAYYSEDLYTADGRLYKRGIVQRVTVDTAEDCEGV